MTRCLLCVQAVAQAVVAYLGPGGAISAVGGVLAVIAGIIVAILGFLWYPIRRLMRRRRKTSRREEDHTGA